MEAGSLPPTERTRLAVAGRAGDDGGDAAATSRAAT